MPKPRLRDLVGRKVRLKRDMTTNGGVTYPAGSMWTVDSVWLNVYMLSQPKSEPNGLARSIRKVAPHDVEPVEVDTPSGL